MFVHRRRLPIRPPTPILVTAEALVPWRSSRPRWPSADDWAREKEAPDVHIGDSDSAAYLGLGFATMPFFLLALWVINAAVFGVAHYLGFFDAP